MALDDFFRPDGLMHFHENYLSVGALQNTCESEEAFRKVAAEHNVRIVRVTWTEFMSGPSREQFHVAIDGPDGTVYGFFTPGRTKATPNRFGHRLYLWTVRLKLRRGELIPEWTPPLE